MLIIIGARRGCSIKMELRLRIVVVAAVLLFGVHGLETRRRGCPPPGCGVKTPANNPLAQHLQLWGSQSEKDFDKVNKEATESMVRFLYFPFLEPVDRSPKLAAVHATRTRCTRCIYNGSSCGLLTGGHCRGLSRRSTCKWSEAF